MTGDDATIRYIVSGRVQGVGFRLFAQMHGLSMGLCGWVRNLPGGDVEAVASGPRQRLVQFEALLWRGPDGARVTSVTAHELETNAGVPGAFEVRR